MSSIVSIIPDPNLSSSVQHALTSGSKFTIDQNFSNGRSLLNYENIEDVDLILLTQYVGDMTAYEFIINLMKNNPTPCLLLFIDGEEKIEIDYPKAMDYGIVASHEITMRNGSILFANLITVRINILLKLRLERFKSQIASINRIKSRIKIDDPELKDKIRRIRTATSIENVKANFNSTVSTEIQESNLLIVIGASTGGPKTLTYIISQFPKNFPPVLVVQHMPEGFLGGFADRMNTHSHMYVKLARDGELIKPGIVYVAPGGYHMELVKKGSKHVSISITSGSKVNFVKPSVDVTLFSAARIFGKNVISVILTGMGSDGREGVRVVKKMGGRCIALNEEESIIYGMNKAVVDAGLADKIVGLDGVVRELAKMIKIE